MISGFQASNIGQLGIDDFSFGAYSRPYGPAAIAAPTSIFSAPGATAQSPFFDDPILDAMGQIIAQWWDSGAQQSGTGVSVIPDSAAWPTPNLPMEQSPVEEAVVLEAAQVPQVIDPEFNPTGTLYEEPIFEEGNEWYERTPATDWGRVYDQYVILNEEPVEVWDWLQNATTVGQIGETVGWWGGDPQQVPGVGALPGAGASGTYGPMPATVTVNTKTGKITKCKRRRRRKLLTESDFNVLLRVATLPNKENVRIVLGKAIGR